VPARRGISVGAQLPAASRQLPVVIITGNWQLAAGY
jgi:hypothetical protein